MKKSIVRYALPLVMMMGATFHVHAVSYGSNLISNGDAESATAGWNAFDGTALFQVADYDSVPGVFLYPDAEHGSYMFTGSADVIAAGWQTVDVSSLAADINTGNVTFKLDGYLGGLGTQEDNTLLYVSFLDASGVEIDHTELGPNYVDLRDYYTVLGGFHTSGYVPVGTQAIQFSLSMEGTDGDSSGAFADNLSFSLASPVPEPTGIALMLGGLSIIGFMRRRAA